jgi:hypothetical protein
MNKAKVKAALKTIALALREFENRRLGKATAHNAECVSISVTLFAGGTRGENANHPTQVSGNILIEGARNDMKTAEGKFLASLFTAGTTNEIAFDNNQELIEILAK